MYEYLPGFRHQLYIPSSIWPRLLIHSICRTRILISLNTFKKSANPPPNSAQQSPSAFYAHLFDTLRYTPFDQRINKFSIAGKFYRSPHPKFHKRNKFLYVNATEVRAIIGGHEFGRNAVRQSAATEAAAADEEAGDLRDGLDRNQVGRDVQARHGTGNAETGHVPGREHVDLFAPQRCVGQPVRFRVRHEHRIECVVFFCLCVYEK